MSASSAIERPKRWDMPFSRERDSDRLLIDDDVDRILALHPFRDLDESSFQQSLSLRDIIKNDVRIATCLPGDIIIREGDWGNSAFYILNGKIRVEIEPPERKFPAQMLGRREIKRKGFLESIAQLWNRHREPEYRDVNTPREETVVGRRGYGDNTRVYLQDVSAVLDQYRTALLEQGQWFGEIAALGRSQRVASVFAETEAELLEIRWQGLRDLMRNDTKSVLRSYIEEMFRERALTSFLRNSPVFRHLDEAQLAEVVRFASFESIGTYDSTEPYKSLKQLATETRIADEPVVAEESEHPYGIILIRSGVARISRTHHNGRRTLGYLTPGQAFGVEEIFEAWKSHQDVPLKSRLSAIGYLNVVIVPTVTVENHVLKPGHADELLRQLPAYAETRAAGAPLSESMLDFCVSHGYVQGTQTMLIDMNRCTRCDDCVRACATTHDNNPRFIRHGPIHDHFMVASACMHCEDPVCMIECPTGAIHRTRAEGNVIINDQTCIGCTQCANNCPYNAIRMVPIRGADGLPVLDDRFRKPLIQATKCDLCIDQLIGPACQNACPHDALVRIDMRNLPKVEEFVHR